MASLRSVKDSTVKRGQVEPHLVTGRYARYVAGILTLNQGYSDGILINNLELLRAEVSYFFFPISVSTEAMNISSFLHQ